ncbi:MAG: hypothetical protein CLLPBCKN_007205 [Chroococcidiopsis cubana SAG 39.79]|uniref:Uncharacterized protein n=1 Tax=Chroococcidiopsis cubana SAG 39.79 TaxID=388085 RepID=A0AB37US02_9CYAN|nr:hypothetical protein [Chroococcidiopsis cubana]MDZ4877770.1 hypothetical protein [Chroococcidiopsis cubana SAG 39.79]PSB62046.1 hypothetical protein C7B79_19585 [Chroococcidiopsis cubana CCALA 043]RUT14051.1 hypothetical protein DSM107010_05340 [Chroococcidiopsis cubana SAG 39.79]
MLGKTSPKTITLLLRLNPNTPEAMVVNYCRDRTISSANQMLQRAINAFYLPQACLEVRKPSLEVRHLALAAIHELQAQIRLIQSSCLPETLNLSSPTDCNRSNTSKSLIRSEVESSVSTSVARAKFSLETMMSEQDWSCC